MKENTKLVALVIVILVVVFGVIIALNSPQHSRKLNPNGGDVTINTQYRGSKISINGIVEYTTKKDNETYTISQVEEGTHQFAVSLSGYFPWAKNIEAKPNTKTTLNSFSILQFPARIDIPNKSEEYREYREQFDSLKIPNEENKLISKDNNIAIWAQNNSVFAEWLGDESLTPSAFCSDGICKTRVTVITSTYNIRSLSYLEDHNFAVLFSDDQGVYAIEIDNDNIQNFQPLYRTPIAQFINSGKRSIIVESQGDMFKLNF